MSVASQVNGQQLLSVTNFVQLNAGRYVDICGWDFETPLVCCASYIAPGYGYSSFAGGSAAGRTDPVSPPGCGVRRLQPSLYYGFYASGYETPAFGYAGIGRTAYAGGRTVVEKWPWMAAIFYGSAIKQLCGGTVIDARHVVTAAHCFRGRSLDSSWYTVLIGEVYVGSQEIRYQIEEIRIHENYQAIYNYDDIAVIRLAQNVPNIVAACLPEDDLLIDGDNCTGLGWGLTSYDGRSARWLQEVELPVVATDVCDDIYASLPRGRFPQGITENMICAGGSLGRDIGACQVIRY
ncbi:Clotting factor B like protein [Argiope bruennichi]|uniref:Clotting factor B like protein n=1 Tax=Argiope bruennichi TaxID=94029 RepID=A0A8T0FTZ2_ARGBR|nr:Clotting factor B like protein [Argiope bruennichi]